MNQAPETELTFLEAPAGASPLLAFMSEMEKEMVRQCGVPREALEKIERRDGWLREPEPAKAGTTKPGPKAKPERRPMTEDERVVVPLLWSQVGYSVGSWDKMFAREIQYALKDGLITEAQSGQVWRLLKRYRRQIVHAEKERLLEVAERLAAPELRRN